MDSLVGLIMPRWPWAPPPSILETPCFGDGVQRGERVMGLSELGGVGHGVGTGVSGRRVNRTGVVGIKSGMLLLFEWLGCWGAGPGHWLGWR
jgi:hypothetical protein